MDWKALRAGIDFARRTGNAGAAVIVTSAGDFQRLVDAGEVAPIGETVGHRIGRVVPGPHLGEGGAALARENVTFLALTP